MVITVTTRVQKVKITKKKDKCKPDWKKKTIETKIVDYNLLFVVTEIQRKNKRRQGNRLKQSLDKLKGKNKILESEGGSTGSHSGEIALENVIDLSQHRLRNDEVINFIANRDNLELENGSSRLLRYVDNYTTIDTALYQRKLESPVIADVTTRNYARMTVLSGLRTGSSISCSVT